MNRTQINTEQPDLVIRRATPADAPIVAELMLMTGEELFRYTFYRDRARTLQVLRALVAEPASSFTYRCAYLAELSGEVAGLIHFIDRLEAQRNDRAMGSLMLKQLGVWGTLQRLPRFATLAGLLGRVPEDGVYINNLATIPAHRRKGIATRLLAFCAQETRRRGLSVMELDVIMGNAPAIAAYRRAGFVVVKEIHSRALRRAYGFPGAYRMRKELGPTPMGRSDRAL
ncbi:MAG: GNAT family N-acetyltransferase [Chloroflexi bacterium]|nr:GNAT family N-acetyltransferase [Chloroflexota bacterium]